MRASIKEVVFLRTYIYSDLDNDRIQKLQTVRISFHINLLNSIIPKFAQNQKLAKYENANSIRSIKEQSTRGYHQ